MKRIVKIQWLNEWDFGEGPDRGGIVAQCAGSMGPFKTPEEAERAVWAVMSKLPTEIEVDF